ncbi:MAG TPA: LOG family protein [Desulfomonilaceae bacterium]|nr:LOG family protein [Desulfomonilaceae bacterium]
MDNRIKIAVLGSASVQADASCERKAECIGAEIAARKAVVLTGACPGLPQAAVQGAKSLGGMTIGISPAMNKEEHRSAYGYPETSDVLLFTGMGTKGRNVMLVRSADACIFVGGRIGTLNEFTIAYDELNEKCAIGILTGSGGFSDEFLRLAELSEKPCRARLVVDSDPGSLIDRVFTEGFR